MTQQEKDELFKEWMEKVAPDFQSVVSVKSSYTPPKMMDDVTPYRKIRISEYVLTRNEEKDKKKRKNRGKWVEVGDGKVVYRKAPAATFVRGGACSPR